MPASLLSIAVRPDCVCRLRSRAVQCAEFHIHTRTSSSCRRFGRPCSLSLMLLGVFCATSAAIRLWGENHPNLPAVLPDFGDTALGSPTEESLAIHCSRDSVHFTEPRRDVHRWVASLPT